MMCKMEVDEQKLHDNTKTVNELIDTLKTNVCINSGDISDGYHTFYELYMHRAHLFAALVGAYPEQSWKSKKHADGTMYDDMFIVGMMTPRGMITYHQEMRDWKLFRCKELEFAPEHDGHSPDDVLYRLCSLVDPKSKTEPSKFNSTVQVPGLPDKETVEASAKLYSYNFIYALSLILNGYHMRRDTYPEGMYLKYMRVSDCTIESWRSQKISSCNIWNMDNDGVHAVCVINRSGSCGLYAPTTEDMNASDWQIAIDKSDP